ncbi:hypothetical protein [Streptomyces sp. bgisy027]|uniref:hypothetical protein n=1 Tax=Streptomyces sp. bgisy027 TaxID=3413770 RepID=UPI003D732999
MNVEIPSHVSDLAAGLGAGVPYALKVLAGRLADDPDMGRPSGLPGILTVTVDGDVFEDCPDLAVGYIREPGRVVIRHVAPASSVEPEADAGEREHEQGPPADPALTVREVADAWCRITRLLRRHAPDSYAALRPGASPGAVAAVEGELGIRIPVELSVLWLLTAGDDGVDGSGCLPGNRALMTLDAVVGVHRRQMDSQARHEAAYADRPEYEPSTVWKAAWIPVVTRGPSDRTSGLYLDTETGHLGRWSRYNDDFVEELDTLVTYLEETADMLEAPSLATRDKPGLVDGALVWLGGIDPGRQSRWRPLAR